MSSEIAKSEKRPAFLVEQQPQGLEGLSDIVRPSFVKIVQNMTEEALVDEFGIGAIILTPDRRLISSGGEAGGVAFVPLLYYTEWVKMTSIKLKNVEPMIVERSFDPQSTVAKKASSERTWSEPHPNHPNDEKYNYRYCENLNFIIKFIEEDLMDVEPVLLTLNRTSFVTGQKLAKLALARKHSLFGGVYLLSTRTREGEYTPKMYTVENHPITPWVTDQALFEQLKKAHEDYDQKLKDRLIVADYDEDDLVDASEATGQY